MFIVGLECIPPIHGGLMSNRTGRATRGGIEKKVHQIVLCNSI